MHELRHPRPGDALFSCDVRSGDATPFDLTLPAHRLAKGIPSWKSTTSTPTWLHPLSQPSRPSRLRTLYPPWFPAFDGIDEAVLPAPFVFLSTGLMPTTPTLSSGTLVVWRSTGLLAVGIVEGAVCVTLRRKLRSLFVHIVVVMTSHLLLLVTEQCSLLLKPPGKLLFRG